VVKGGPAEKAGIKKDDVIISYRGKEITDASALRNEVATTPIGEEAKVTLIRGGKREDLAVRVGSLEEATKILGASVKDRLGADIRPVSSQEAEKYGLEEGQGVAITSEDSKGALRKAGFEVGDIILEINYQPVQGVESFVSMIKSLQPQQQIVLLALDHRTGQTGNVRVTVH